MSNDKPVTLSRGPSPSSPPGDPVSRAITYAAVSITEAGSYISIWSHKAETWVRLLNRYKGMASAREAIDAYGWTYWQMSEAPHGRERYRHPVTIERRRFR